MNAQGVLELLKERVLIADGAMGSMLLDAGVDPGPCPELLNITAPDVITGIHAAYLKAGSDMVLTHSFGANPFKLSTSGQEGKTRELNLAAARNARRAAEDVSGAGRTVFVAGDMGPSGQLVSPLGPVSEKELEDGFREQAEALAEAGVDLILIETLSAVEEAAAALRAARGTGLAVGISFSFSPGARGYRTAMGVDTALAAGVAADEGADLLGANCGSVSPEEMFEVLGEMRKAAGIPLLGEPNAGAPRILDGKTVYDSVPGVWAGPAARLREAGAGVIGGCCGSTPGHISALAARLSIAENPMG